MAARVRCWTVKNDMKNLIRRSSWSTTSSETQPSNLLAKLRKDLGSMTPSSEKRLLRSRLHESLVDHIFSVRQRLPDHLQGVFTQGSQSSFVSLQIGAFDLLHEVHDFLFESGFHLLTKKGSDPSGFETL